MDIYTIEFDPNRLSHQQEMLGLRYADYDTAVELMKKEEKMIIAELTLYYTRNSKYKNMTELNGLIYSDKKFKEFCDRYHSTLKQRNQAKIKFETFKSFRDDLRTKVVNERELAKHL